MDYSQNGWIANDRSLVAKHFVAGTERYFVIRKGDVGTVLIDFLNWFHVNIEAIDGGIYDDWAYAERLIIGSQSMLSNHASGTAVDVNATRHPLGRRGTFTPAQTSAIRTRLKFYEGAIRWGGDYTNRADEMHFEINKSSSFVAVIADKIRNAAKVTPTAPPTTVRPSPVRPTPWGSKTYLERGDSNSRVGVLQRRLKALGFYTGMVDDDFGPKTEAAVKAFQFAAGIDDDGIWGRVSEGRVVLVPAFPGNSIQRSPQQYLWTTLFFQRKLKARGWNIEPDGWHGDKTTAVFRGFQSSKKLSVTGRGDAQLWTAIHAQPIT